MRRILVLFTWVTFMLMPISWAGRLFPGLRGQFAPLLRPLIGQEWAHVVAHTALFAGLAALVGLSLQLPRSFRGAAVVMAVVLLAGLGQEWLQLMAKGRAFGPPEAYDLVVDLLGGFIGLGLWDVIAKLSFPPFWRARSAASES